MKEFIVDTGGKKYKVEANTYNKAISLVKAIRLKDEASPLQTVNALLEDERAAVDAYNVALENLKGKIPNESYMAIEAIRDDENRHIENLQAVVNGNVTEKNLEDSIKRINAIDASIDYASADSDDDYLDSIEKLLRQKANIYVDAFIDNARGSFHISKNYRQKRNLNRDDLNTMINVLRSSTDLKDLRSENPDRFDAVIRGTIPGYGT